MNKRMWSFQVSMRNLNDDDREFLKCDLAYFVADLQRSFKMEINKMVNDRSWRSKIISLSQRLSSVLGKPVTDFNSAFASLKGIDLKNCIKYEIIAGGNSFRMDIDQLLFDIWATMGDTMAFGLPVGKYIFTKKTILKRFEDEIRKEYTSDFDIKEIPTI